MVKHTQTIIQLLPTNCLSLFDHLVGLALKVLNNFVHGELMTAVTEDKCFNRTGNVRRIISTVLLVLKHMRSCH